MDKIYMLAKNSGACAPGLKSIQAAENVADLIQLLKTQKGIEFAMDSEFLPFEVLEEYRSELEKESIFISGHHHVESTRLVMALGGQIDVKVDGFQVCEIYAKGISIINLVASDNAFVSIESYGQAEVVINKSGNAKVKEYKK